MNTIPTTPRTKLRRVSERGLFEREVIHAILDEALICHVGFLDDIEPVVIPTIHVRVGDRLYIHGSSASRMLKCLSAGVAACISVTLVDGLVLARSAFHHSMNYRSVVLFGVATAVTDLAAKHDVLEALSEHAIPGRWADVRKPSENELNGTAVLSFPIDEASAKVRSGPPSDDAADYDLPVWAGVIPLAQNAGPPQPDPRLTVPTEIPDYASNYHRPAAS